MPLYIPWLTETIKKRGVRYLLHHYLGQFFEEKLTLEQLSIDIYEGKGSIKHLTLDVDGLNDELDFVPFRFLDGCSIGQISVEVPWSSLATEACRVELEGAKFICRLKTSADATKHCTESTLLSRSLMTSSMRMAEDIITTEDDECESPVSSMFKASKELPERSSHGADHRDRKKNANQMFEGLEMFAQLIDSVLRRTKLTARNTLFQIRSNRADSNEYCDDIKAGTCGSSGDEFSEPLACSSSGSRSDEDTDSESSTNSGLNHTAANTVEFFIKFFRCEEIIDQATADNENLSTRGVDQNHTEFRDNSSQSTITKLLTLEDVEMRIDGSPVSNLIGKHTITIKFDGHKSEISVYSSSPLLAVIGHKQLDTFFNVFDSSKSNSLDSNSLSADMDQKMMSPEDYAKIENQLLETVSLSGTLNRQTTRETSDNTSTAGTIPFSTQTCSGNVGGRRWVETGYVGCGDHNNFSRGRRDVESVNDSNIDHLTTSRYQEDCHMGRQRCDSDSSSSAVSNRPTLDNIEAFSCELKLPGIWLCILRDGEQLPPLIKPFADSINSFQSINKYISDNIKVPHIRCLALKVAMDITATGTNIFIGDLDISEHLLDNSTRVSPILQLVKSDLKTNIPLNVSRYKASIVNGKDINIEMLASTRILIDPTIIDRLVYDYKLIKTKAVNNLEEADAAGSDMETDRETKTTASISSRHNASSRSQPTKKSINEQASCLSSSLTSRTTVQRSVNSLDLSLNVIGERFKLELLCPIPDLTPEAENKPTLLRPQSFIFDFKNISLIWHSDKLNISASEMTAHVKTQPKQSDSEAVKFIEATSKGNDKIILMLEPSPSNLDNAFTSDIERALNESTMYDSIYVSQATESGIPTTPFQTKRKVVRAQPVNNNKASASSSLKRFIGSDNHDHEKILTPGDRKHLSSYLEQTMMSTKLALQLHLPICEMEFEDKEQLDLIYNRFGNDFVFWHPKVFGHSDKDEISAKPKRASKKCGRRNDSDKYSLSEARGTGNVSISDNEDESDAEEHASYYSASYRSKSCHEAGIESPAGLDCYENQLTCKIQVDELYIKFSHQMCASALKQEIAADNLLLGVVIDVNKRPGTLLSLVADNLELSNDLAATPVLDSNSYMEKSSTFGLTADIKRPTPALKEIKLAVQLRDCLFRDFRTDTYSRFWQSINVTDEPILGYKAPKILTEIHVDFLNTILIVVKEGVRPSLLSIDELYLTSMVMEQTSQVMIRLVADEVALYMKRDREGLELMKNYICLIDSGLIDLDVKFSQEGRLEFSVINNVITIRVCQDSLSALCRLFDVLVRSNSQKTVADESSNVYKDESCAQSVARAQGKLEKAQQISSGNDLSEVVEPRSRLCSDQGREANLLEDAMNDYADYMSVKSQSSNASINDTENSCDESDDAASQPDESERRPSSANNTCLLDESNPKLGDLFSKPLVPTNIAERLLDEEQDASDEEEAVNQEDDAGSTGTRNVMEESGFFVIGDDDVGAGIMKSSQQQEPMVRKLIDGPISIIDNYFKMTKPRTLPEMLANSLERYVLEEMTLVVNLFGGRDFDDQSEAHEEHECEKAEEAREQPSGCSISREQAVVGDKLSAPSGVDLCGKICEPGSLSGVTQASAGAVALGPEELSAGILSRTLGSECASFDSMKAHNNSLLQSASRARAATGGCAAAVARSSSGSSSTSKTGDRHSYRPGEVAANIGGSLRRRARRKHMSEGSALGTARMGPEGALEPHRVRFGEGAVNLWESLDLISSPDFLNSGASWLKPDRMPLCSDSKQAGGTWRQSDVCIQFTLNKVKLLFELADLGELSAAPLGCQSQANTNPSASLEESAPAAATTNLAHSVEATKPEAALGQARRQAPISWRFMLFVHEIEVKDRIAASDINKMLYEYCTESMPKRSTQFLTIRNVATINQSDGCEECDLRVSLKPLRLNIDQDALVFLIDFFTTFSKSLAKQQALNKASYSPVAGAKAAAASGASLQHQQQATNVALNSGAVCARSLHSTGSKRDRGAGGRAANEVVEAQAAGADGGKTKDVKLVGAQLETSSNSSASELASAGREMNASRGRTHRLGASSGATTTARGSSLSPSDQRSAARSSFDEDLMSSAASGCSANDSSGSSDTARGAKQLHQRPASASCANSSQAASDAPQLAGRPGRQASIKHHHASDGARANQQPIYIKSFIFSPDVPIRIDYHAKHLDFEQGALAGILMGLAHLDHSELILRRVQAKHGMRGLDRVLLFALNSWLSDIKRNQLPSILGGVGPMHSVIQLFQGMRDLVWMPIDHYRKDGRLVRGLQRGASSFSSSTAMAAINLVNRFISIVQCTAQIAHDIVTPPGDQLAVLGAGASRLAPSSLHRRRRRRVRLATGTNSAAGRLSSLAQSSLSPAPPASHAVASAASARFHHNLSVSGSQGGASVSERRRANSGLVGASTSTLQQQPRNFCEGVTVGFSILKEGLSDTARNVTVGMQAEDMRSAVGELVRQIPSTLLNPIISATEGAQSVLVGIRNQIAPDARREDQDKWKGRVRGGK